MKNSYSFKIMVSFAVVTFCGVLISGFIFYNMSKQMLLENSSLILNDYTNQMLSYVSKQMEKIQGVAHSFLFDAQFHLVISAKYEPYESYDMLSNLILPKGNSALKSFGREMGMNLYLHNTSINEHYYTESIGTFNVMHMERLGTDPVVEAMRKANKYIIWGRTEKDKEDDTVKLYTRLIDFNTFREDGILILTVRAADLFLDSDGDSLPAIFFEIAGEGFEVQKTPFEVIEANNHMMLEKPVAINGFKLRTYIHISNFNPKIRDSITKALLVSIASFFSSLLLGLVFKRFLYNDVSIILNGIKQMQNGNNFTLIEGSKNKEFKQIADAFNQYAENMERLINDVYEAEVQKQDIEFSMLQAKINPHFLYNIFAIMSEFAKAGLNASVIKVLDKTAAFYRQVLSKDTCDHTLEEEIDSVNAYMDIINTIKPNEISICYEVADETLKAYMPRFFLQPIAENSVKHANSTGELIITVRSFVEGGKLKIEIKDNGFGMTAEQIDRCTRYRNKGGYGLYSIIERLRLRYPQPEYGFSIQSEYGKGTTVLFTLPYLTEYPDGDLYV